MAAGTEAGAIEVVAARVIEAGVTGGGAWAPRPPAARSQVRPTTALIRIGKLRAYKVDTYRHAVERMKPSWYGDARCYERMLAGVTTLLVGEGVVLLRTLSAVLAVACRCPIPWHDCQSCKPSILKHQRRASHRVTLCG